MKLYRSFLVMTAVGMGLVALTNRASANDPYSPAPSTLARAIASHFHHEPQQGPRFPQLRARLQNFHLLHKPNLPVFQAAPWYQYWPYDGHFLTPAPISGPFHAPPLTGHFPVNPYFPPPMTPPGGQPNVPPPPPAPPSK
ncbi:MAG: hypothetical protein RMJ56_03130 [Gemmataceae bacterium]|nr:hypothetical protein [Gemmata sp.]MDW8196581.1 hypothetical protein [Gemmataceae bacterium]